MHKIKLIILSSIITLFALVTKAQDSMPAKISLNNTAVNSQQKVEMAGILYENGKIYLVVLVLLTIFAGIIFYLIRLEKKLNKLENQ